MSTSTKRVPQPTKSAIEAAVAADSRENAGIWSENAALREAVFGNISQASRAAAEGLQLAPESQGVVVQAALAMDIAGESGRAQSLIQDLDKRYPLDTQVQSLWLPAARARLALNHKNPVDALRALQNVEPPLEFGATQFMVNPSCIYPTYVKGQAYLASGQRSEAAKEFQKIIAHSGMVWNCATGALPHLGLARAYVQQRRNATGAEADAARVHALTQYKQLLELWKDADPDVPVYKAAKDEYSRLL